MVFWTCILRKTSILNTLWTVSNFVFFQKFKIFRMKNRYYTMHPIYFVDKLQKLLCTKYHWKLSRIATWRSTDLKNLETNLLTAEPIVLSKLRCYFDCWHLLRTENEQAHCGTHSFERATVLFRSLTSSSDRKCCGTHSFEQVTVLFRSLTSSSDRKWASALRNSILWVSHSARIKFDYQDYCT